MERLLVRIVDHLRASEQAFECALIGSMGGDNLSSAERTHLEALGEARQRLVDDVDKLVSILRKLK